MGIANRDVRGWVQGRTVVLEEDPGLPFGQAVTVTIATRPSLDADALEKLRRAAGGWAEEAEDLDLYLEENRAQRKLSRPEIGE